MPRSERTIRDRGKGLDAPGGALWRRMTASYALDDAQQAVLWAACRELDVSERLRDAADPDTVEGRRRLSLARMSGLAFTSHMKALDALLKPKPERPKRARKQEAEEPPHDPRLKVAE